MQIFRLAWTAAWIVGTIALVAVVLYHLRAKPAWMYGLASTALLFLAAVLLGIWRGPLAWGVGAAIDLFLCTDRFRNWRDCRLSGKRIARELGIKPNLLFSAIELAFDLTNGKGSSVMYFAAVTRSPNVSRDEVYQAVIPGLVIGFDMLEKRYGSQPSIEAARVKIAPYVQRYCTN